MNIAEMALERDASDQLASKRAMFQLPENTIYLDGNSLGALSTAVADDINSMVQQQWGGDLIAGWNQHDWINLPVHVGDLSARLMGAAPGQVLCCDNLSSNLFKLLVTALSINQPRTVIVTEAGNFPSDNYVLDGLARLLGPERLQVRKLEPEEIVDADLSDVAAVMLTHVNFRTGAKYDLAGVTARVQEQGALMLWDLAHSIGVCDLNLDAANVDMAVGCTYKFLNGGPGAPGLLYLAKRHAEVSMNPIAGWMGHGNRFAFSPEYEPAAGVERFLTGTPSILGLSAVASALRVYEGVSPDMFQYKSEQLTGFFLEARNDFPLASALVTLTPNERARRGSQVSLCHPQGYAIAQALIAEGVIVDFREPDIVRFGFSPLYNTFSEVLTALQQLEDVLVTTRYLAPEFQIRKAVT